MQNVTFRLPQLHEYGSAYFDYLKLRKRYFVDELGWGIPHDDEFEMDQYDTPRAYYSLALHHGRVIGGARLMPTDTIWGDHTYMLRDAADARIKGIPCAVAGQAVVSKQVWEITRLVIDPDLGTVMERNACLAAIGEGLETIADQTECQEFVGLTPPTVARALRRIGYVAENVGEPYRCACDGRRYGIIRIPVAQKVYELAAE